MLFEMNIVSSSQKTIIMLGIDAEVDIGLC